MKKIFLAALIVSFVGCSTFSHNPYERISGYIVTKDGTKIEFSDSRVFHYKRDIIILNKGSEMTFDLGDVQSFHIEHN